MKKQLLCMLVLTLLLTGCFKKSDEKMTEQIENQIENILAISDTQNAAIDYSETAQTERVVMEKTQVKVVRIVDDTIAILSIEAINMPNLFDQAYDSLNQKDDGQTDYDYINSYITGAIADNKYTTITNEIEVGLDNSSGETQIILSEEFVDAVYGGFLSYSISEGGIE